MRRILDEQVAEKQRRKEEEKKRLIEEEARYNLQEEPPKPKESNEEITKIDSQEATKLPQVIQKEPEDTPQLLEEIAKETFKPTEVAEETFKATQQTLTQKIPIQKTSNKELEDIDLFKLQLQVFI